MLSLPASSLLTQVAGIRHGLQRYGNCTGLPSYCLVRMNAGMGDASSEILTLLCHA